MLARQIAWARVRVKGPDGKTLPLSRMEQIQDDGGHLEMPELTFPHLWVWLQDVGMCERGDMGLRPVTALELRAWAAGAGATLASWEFRALRAASRAFVAQSVDNDPLPPYGDPNLLADPEVVEGKIAQTLDTLSRPVKRNNL